MFSNKARRSVQGGSLHNATNVCMCIYCTGFIEIMNIINSLLVDDEYRTMIFVSVKN